MRNVMLDGRESTFTKGFHDSVPVCPPSHSHTLVARPHSLTVSQSLAGNDAVSFDSYLTTTESSLQKLVQGKASLTDFEDTQMISAVQQNCID